MKIERNSAPAHLGDYEREQLHAARVREYCAACEGRAA